MSVHSAKGLEFKHVFMPYLQSASFPLNYKSNKVIDRIPLKWKRWNYFDHNEKTIHYQEERRLFYVAITRAKETLTLYGTEKKQSIFIRDIGVDLLIKKSINILDKKKNTKLPKETDKIEMMKP